MQQGAGDQHALLHAFGVRRNRRVAVLVKPEQAEQFDRLALHLRFRQAAQPADQLQVFQAGEVWIYVRLFRDVTETPLEADQVVADVGAVPEDLAGGGGQQAGEHFHGGRFAAPVGPQVSCDLARRDGKRHVIDYGAIAIFLREPADV